MSSVSANHTIANGAWPSRAQPAASVRRLRASFNQGWRVACLDRNLAGARGSQRERVALEVVWRRVRVRTFAQTAEALEGLDALVTPRA
jgi:hypothetical protein